MTRKDLQKAQDLIDVLRYDEGAITGWQHELLESVVTLAESKIDDRRALSRRSLLSYFITWYNAMPLVKKPKDGLITIAHIDKFLSDSTKTKQ